MGRKSKVNVVFIIIAVIAISVAIFSLSKSNSNPPIIDSEIYEDNIRTLNDTIKELKEDILLYQKEIERIDLEREKIRQQLNQIIKENEDTDIELSNGDWDYNIKFLSEFLSKKDSLGK
jgi:peptidoglycan hydrolase CwlO-like protein